MKEFITNCVSAKGGDIEAMVNKARKVSYKAMAKACNLQEWTQAWGVPLYKDYAVSFYKSTYKGMPCYFFVHSAIEYVFV